MVLPFFILRNVNNNIDEVARQIPKFCEASICHNVIMLGKKIAKVLSSCGRLTN